MAPDPLENKYAGMNPYSYCANNPITYQDPDGRDHIHIKSSSTTVLPRSTGLDGVTIPGSGQNFYSSEVTTVEGKDRFFYDERITIINSEGTTNTRQKSTEFFPLDHKQTGITKSQRNFGTGNDDDFTTLAKLAPDQLVNYLLNKDSKTYQAPPIAQPGLRVFDVGQKVAAAALLIDGALSVKDAVLEARISNNLGGLKSSAREALENENNIITPAEGLQTSSKSRFRNVVLGQHGDKESTYLWTIDKRGVSIALEKTPMNTPRGTIVHSNISSRAYIAGEAWFESENTVVINAGSGRFGDGNPAVNEKVWETAQKFWNHLGYKVKAIPFGKR